MQTSVHGTSCHIRKAHRGDGICLCLEAIHAHWALIIRLGILPPQALVAVQPLDFLRVHMAPEVGELGRLARARGSLGWVVAYAQVWH